MIENADRLLAIAEERRARALRLRKMAFALRRHRDRVHLFAFAEEEEKGAEHLEAQAAEARNRAATSVGASSKQPNARPAEAASLRRPTPSPECYERPHATRPVNRPLGGDPVPE